MRPKTCALKLKTPTQVDAGLSCCNVGNASWPRAKQGVPDGLAWGTAENPARRPTLSHVPFGLRTLRSRGGTPHRLHRFGSRAEQEGAAETQQLESGKSASFGETGRGDETADLRNVEGDGPAGCIVGTIGWQKSKARGLGLDHAPSELFAVNCRRECAAHMHVAQRWVRAIQARKERAEQLKLVVPARRTLTTGCVLNPESRRLPLTTASLTAGNPAQIPSSAARHGVTSRANYVSLITDHRGRALTAGHAAAAHASTCRPAIASSTRVKTGSPASASAARNPS